MGVSRNVLLAGLAAGAIAIGGTALAQEGSTHPMRTIQVPSDAVVLVIPGARVLAPGAVQTAYGPDVDALFSRMDRQIDALMSVAAPDMPIPTQMALPPTSFRLVPAAMAPLPTGQSSGVMVTTVSDGRHSCTERVTFGPGAAPIVRTSGDACGAIGARTVAPAAWASRPAIQSPSPVQPWHSPRAHLVLADAAQ